MRLRFAPSPTGFLHVGNARVALANWLFARQNRARFLLRLDDTDTQRGRPEYAAAIEEDLAWLGLDWDEFFRQSDRNALYDEAAAKLKADGRLYPCFESEEELRFKREQRLRQNKAPIYDRGSLRMTEEQLQRALANGKTPYWRFKLSAGSVGWQDGVLGERQVKLTSQSDPVLIRADGSYLYTFTSVVDDLRSGVSHVIRGEDHVTNTGVQLDLYAALGGDVRNLRFGHLPLLLDAEGGPLSKRLGSLSLRQMRRDGMEPAAVTGYLAGLGTARDPIPASPRALLESFSLGSVSHSSPRFDPRQLLGLNRKLLHALSFSEVQERLPEGADATFWDAVRGNLDLLREAKDWWEVVHGHIAPPELPEDAGFLKQAHDALPAAPWDATTWKQWTTALQAATGRKGKALFLPLRLALTGEEHGPELASLLPLIGHDRAAQRLALAAGGHAAAGGY